jgi:hypothetical protein
MTRHRNGSRSTGKCSPPSKTAEPFVDNPNRVLRRLFELPAIEKDGTAAFPAKIARAPRSSLLPLADFELAILRAVSEAGGEASRSKLVEVLGQRLRIA